MTYKVCIHTFEYDRTRCRMTNATKEAVTTDVPDNSIVSGMPTRIIGTTVIGFIADKWKSIIYGFRL